MPVQLTPVITLAGLAAIFNATNNGLQAIISQIALGDTAWAPDDTATALQNELSRIDISNSRRLNPTQIHLTAVEDTDLEFWVREVGFYLDDGTLLAIWSDPDQVLAFKSAEVDLLLGFDLVLSALPNDSITIDGTGGVNLAPATETDQGIVRMATRTEAVDGLLRGAVAVTPDGMRIHGDNHYAEKSHRHFWFEIDGKPIAFPPIPHRHFWVDIDNKPSEFPPENHVHEWDQIANKPDVFPPAPHGTLWTDLIDPPRRFPPMEHDHDDFYIKRDDLVVTSGRVQTQNRKSENSHDGSFDLSTNFVDVFPPAGFTMNDLLGFHAGIGRIFFAGEVNGDDILWVRWVNQGTHVRIVCNNSENRAASSVVYMGIWRRVS